MHMTGTDRARREVVLHEVALRVRKQARRSGARRAAVLRAAANLRMAASTGPGDGPSA
jgi:hypothetical protein